MTSSADRNADGTAPGRRAAPRITTLGVVFLVIAIVAPIGGISGPVSLGMAYGNGAGIAGAFLISGIIVLCFAVGLAAMSRHVTNMGAFYAYVSLGVGRPAGVATAFIALLAYNSAFLSMCGYVGFFSREFGLHEFGVGAPWYLYTAVVLLLVGLLGRRDIGVSTRLLTVLVTLELTLFAAFDAGVAVQRGLHAYTLKPFSLDSLNSGGLHGFAIAMLFSMFCFGGVEQAAVYAEEARRPERTVARATIGAVLAITTFYTLTSWSMSVANGSIDLQSAARAAPGTYGLELVGQVLGPRARTLMNALILSSMLASMVGLHQTIARYTVALARDRLLPGTLAHIHGGTGAPRAASAAALSLAAIVCIACVIAGRDPLLTLASSLSGMTTIGTLLLWTGASIAIIAYFRRRGDRRLIATLLLPGVAVTCLIVLVVLTTRWYGLITGVDNAWINGLPWLFAVCIGAGFVCGARGGVRLTTQRSNRGAILGPGGDPPAEVLKRAPPDSYVQSSRDPRDRDDRGR